ncbi:nucleotidyl transferase AbiEii/AbiGii toxin family protein [Leyella stercorea]|jgi:predicted nucleotidyltransferase component of viral defense system|uniref:nucleotidyl transferase AbiEii/AbiGii toxin family protein n=1 Tax=Leyella stercorea TaxID=363265 RepID=UPI00266D4633|nr:nucleotidyl transferase AbiEii/AbiGii toxin family protein [Leyella stercorea]
MLSYCTVEPNTLELLKALMQEPDFSKMRLVGGTALALQYAHRKSIDLDFFGDLECEQEDTFAILSKYGKVETIKETKTIRIYAVNGIKVDFVHYSCYPWIDAPVSEDGIRLASTKDIAAMKINAIEGRGTRKDFVDVYFLLKHYTLPELLDFYKDKYPDHSFFRALMSLTYFEDAEMQPMPKMLCNESWEDMKKTIIEEVRKI